MSFLWIYLFLKKSKSSFCPWLYSLGALLEDGIPVPKEMEIKTFFRILTGCWILTAVILTNCYNGSLNSPLESVSVKTFKDLVCDYQHLKYSYQDYQQMESNSTISRTKTNTNFALQVDAYFSRLFGSNTTQYPRILKNFFSLLSVPSSDIKIPEVFVVLL